MNTIHYPLSQSHNSEVHSVGAAAGGEVAEGGGHVVHLWNSSYNQVIITRSCLTSTSVSMLVTEPAVPDSSFLAVRLR